jgi:hypothetical protein
LPIRVAEGDSEEAHDDDEITEHNIEETEKEEIELESHSK